MQWPSTSVCGLATALTIRRVIASDSIFSLECTDATTTSSRSSSSSSWSSEPSSRMSTSMPVRIRNGASSSLSSGHHVELLAQPLRREAVGHGQPRRVVGQHDVLVAEVAGRTRHLVDRAAAVGPQRVGVQVAAQRRSHRRAALGDRPDRRGLELGEVLRHLALAGLHRHRGRLGPDALELGERPCLDPLLQLTLRQRRQHVGGPPVGLHAVRRLPGALEQEADPAQGLDLGRGAVHQADGRRGPRPAARVPGDVRVVSAGDRLLSSCDN